MTTEENTIEDAAVLEAAVAAVRDAGRRLLARYSEDARPADRAGLLAAAGENERTSNDELRRALAAARPQAKWLTDELETTELPPGEWWAVDAVEGNVNHVHGLPEWCVSATLLRDGVPVLAAVYQPVPDVVHSAVRGGGAFANGRRLSVSAKAELGAAIATTGQAEASTRATPTGASASRSRRCSAPRCWSARPCPRRSRCCSSPPGTPTSSGSTGRRCRASPCGALFITEAGGTVTDLAGQPWRPGSADILASAPALHAAALATLSTVN